MIALGIALAGPLDGALVRAEPLDAGISTTWKVELEGGVLAVFKEDGSDLDCWTCTARREVAVYRLDRLLGVGLVPETRWRRLKLRDGPAVGSLQRFVEGTVPGSVSPPPSPPAKLRWFDAVIGNSDRHLFNWIVTPDGVAAIDHDRAFRWGEAGWTDWKEELAAIDPDEVAPLWKALEAASDKDLRKALRGVSKDDRDRFLEMRIEILAAAKSPHPATEQPE